MIDETEYESSCKILTKYLNQNETDFVSEKNCYQKKFSSNINIKLEFAQYFTTKNVRPTLESNSRRNTLNNFEFCL